MFGIKKPDHMTRMVDHHHLPEELDYCSELEMHLQRPSRVSSKRYYCIDDHCTLWHEDLDTLSLQFLRYITR